MFRFIKQLWIIATGHKVKPVARVVKKPIITWRCHVCGRKRPDEKISVRVKRLMLDGIYVGDQNIRYCNDNIECVEGSYTYSHYKDGVEFHDKPKADDNANAQHRHKVR